MSSIVPESFESAFDGKRDILTRKLKVADRLLTLLKDAKLITDYQRKAIEKENATEERMAGQLMDELLRADDSKVDVFLKCLVKNEQSHVVKIILGERGMAEWEGQPTKEMHRELVPATSDSMTSSVSTKEQVHNILDKALPALRRELDVDHGLFPLLVAKGALTSDQIEECKAAATRAKRVETMVEILKLSQLSSYAKFRETLSGTTINRDDLVKQYLPEISP